MIFCAPQRRTLSTLVLVPLFALGICHLASALLSAPPWSRAHSAVAIAGTNPWPPQGETGSLVFSLNGVEFRSHGGASRRWSFTEIRTLDLTPRGFVLTTYRTKAGIFPATGNTVSVLQTHTGGRRGPLSTTRGKACHQWGSRFTPENLRFYTCAPPDADGRHERRAALYSNRHQLHHFAQPGRQKLADRRPDPAMAAGVSVQCRRLGWLH